VRACTCEKQADGQACTHIFVHPVIYASYMRALARIDGHNARIDGHNAQDDPVEIPVPEQFETKIRNGKLVTTCVAHIGA